MKDLVLNLLAGLLVVAATALSLALGGIQWIVELPAAGGWAAFGHGVMGLIYFAVGFSVTLDIGRAARRPREEADR